MSIKKILGEIQSEPSSNGKIEILKKYSDNNVLKNVLYHTYSPLINYWVRDYAESKTGRPAPGSYTLQEALSDLDKIINRVITGNSARSFLEQMDASLYNGDKAVLRKIISRDLGCGISAKSINKAFPELIPTIPYMRCSLTDKLPKIVYPAIVQRKADGAFVNVVYKDGLIKFFTRNGTEFELNCIKDDLQESLSNNRFGDVVLHGELLVCNDDKTEKSRKEGNGLINSLIKKEQTLNTLADKLRDASPGSKFNKLSSEYTRKVHEFESTDNQLKLVVWDCVDYSDWVKGVSLEHYGDRLNRLVPISNTHVVIIDTITVGSQEEAYAYYKEQIDLGFEGAVLKNIDGEWRDHTSPNQIKLKSEKECELIVIGINPGEGKYLGGVGSLLCTSSDGLINVNVGSGLCAADAGFERVDENDSSKGIQLIEGFDGWEEYVGKIITVKFNELITSEQKDTVSMFLPRFLEIRDDKDVADSLEYIKTL